MPASGFDYYGNEMDDSVISFFDCRGSSTAIEVASGAVSG
tara:strand:- start:3573 stop:3692 length:120 start_codon:yes stop_codon:yes gene_type:complete